MFRAFHARRCNLRLARALDAEVHLTKRIMPVLNSRRNLMRRFKFIAAVLALVLMPGLASGASTHVPVGSWVYGALERLEAEGLLDTGILASRPISRMEAARLVSRADGRAPSPAASRLMDRLKREFALEMDEPGPNRLRAIEEARFRYLYAEGTPRLFSLNNMGDEFGNGSNLRADFSSSAVVGDLAAFYLNPEIRFPEGSSGDDAELYLVEGYAALERWNIELTAGRQALWWSPGHHGALLLSDNARPFDLLKLTNPRPATLPWLFKYLGPVRFTGFVTRLEEDRDFANPYLAGVRLDLKPHRLVSIGLARTAMFGGAGRHVDAGVIWDVITASGENIAAIEPGNQLGSVDLKVVLPFEAQKVVVYGELGGEDEAGGLPSRVAYIMGAYLPDILGVDGLDLRAEYGQTYIGKYPGVWYAHHIYTSGYTYDGRIIGHHMGADAKDLFVSVAWATGFGDLKASVELETSGRAVKTRNRSAALAWSRYVSDTTELALGYAFDRRTSVGGVAGQDENAHSFTGGVRLDF